MSAEYLISVSTVGGIPDVLKGKGVGGKVFPRIALVGRSNVGKSTLINSLVGQNVARVSKVPGKTRAIHFFWWKEANKILVDLPGYGFARRSEGEVAQWGRLMGAYLKQDPMLERALVLLDARQGPTHQDEDAVRFLLSFQVPITFVMTKVDALRTQKDRVRRNREMGDVFRRWRVDPKGVIWVSSRTEDGIETLNRLIC